MFLRVRPDFPFRLTNIIIAMSEYMYCICGTTCYAVARVGPLMLFDQSSKHCWWRGMHPQHPERWNRPCQITRDFYTLAIFMPARASFLWLFRACAVRCTKVNRMSWNVE